MSAGSEEIRQILVDPSQFAADWKVIQSQVSVGNIAWVPIVGANPRRISLFFQLSGVGNGQWTTNNSLPVSSGFQIPNPSTPAAERLTLGEHGGIVQQQIFAVGAGGVVTVEVCETIWLPLGG